MVGLESIVKKSGIDIILEQCGKNVYDWNDEMVLCPVAGTAYIIRGALSSLTNILKADGIYWRNRSSKQKGKSRLSYYFTAIPDLHSMNLNQRCFSRKDAFRLCEVSFRKTVCFYFKHSVFVVEFRGDQNQFPWRKSKALMKWCLLNVRLKIL